MIALPAILLVVAMSSVICEGEKDEKVEIPIPLNLDINGQVDAKIHAAKVSGTTSIGGGLEVKLDNGAVGAVDVTHQLGAGTKLDVGASVPLFSSDNNRLDANVHASRVFDEPSNKAQSVGGGLNYNDINGVKVGVNANNVQGAGTRLDVNANVPLYSSDHDRLDANVHGSHVFDSAFKAQSVGGGLQYNNDNGLFGNVDATHHQGVGNSYSANMGRSFDVGPGTLSVGVGATKNSWSSGFDKNFGISYRVPF